MLETFAKLIFRVTASSFTVAFLIVLAKMSLDAPLACGHAEDQAFEREASAPYRRYVARKELGCPPRRCPSGPAYF
jgi:hypothetical protein